MASIQNIWFTVRGKLCFQMYAAATCVNFLKGMRWYNFMYKIYQLCITTKVNKGELLNQLLCIHNLSFCGVFSLVFSTNVLSAALNVGKILTILKFQFRVQHESTIKYKSIIFMDQITYFTQPLIFKGHSLEK